MRTATVKYEGGVDFDPADGDELVDYQRELRILRLQAETMGHMAAGRTAEGHVSFAQMKLEIRDRSPEQVKRMEIAQYLRLSEPDRGLFKKFGGRVE